MIRFSLFGYEFTIDRRGNLASTDADSVTLATLQYFAERERWNSPLPDPWASYNALRAKYETTLLEAPELDTSGVTGEVVY